ncbi:MarR family winged helix-turn-helix transcriptional regulator [Streptomyces sp. enrichment culture]|uniref:MarR family winged helix-turn-helix transcriptional regulator n=1 Tax=Streptomyces sp. enrichment culture TaxID=1795815 RepID=UPI003F55EC81
MTNRDQSHVTESHDEGAPDAGVDGISRLWERIVPMYSLLEGRLDRVLAHRHGIGLGPLMALGLLVKSSPAPLSVSGVAGRLGVSVSAASRVLARLEEQGRAVRVAWPCDRRAGRVTATEAGSRLWTQASRTLDRELSAAFRTLRFDERYAHVAARLCRAEDEPPAP